MLFSVYFAPCNVASWGISWYYLLEYTTRDRYCHYMDNYSRDYLKSYKFSSKNCTPNFIRIPRLIVVNLEIKYVNCNIVKM
jgi:hypothetical protein